MFSICEGQAGLHQGAERRRSQDREGRSTPAQPATHIQQTACPDSVQSSRGC